MVNKEKVRLHISYNADKNCHVKYLLLQHLLFCFDIIKVITAIAISFS